MTRERAAVTVFLPTWNAGPRLDEVLEAVRGQRTSRELVLRATDSGSSDGTLERLARHKVAVERIEQRDFDHGATRGAAIASSSTEFVVLLTQDARPADEHWLEELLAPFDDARVAGTWSKQVPRPQCHPFQRANLAAHFAGPDQRVLEPLEAAQWAGLPPAQRLARLGFDDVSSAVRRSAVERVPFPRTPFGEDLLWSRSALLAGWRLCYAGRSVVEHSHDLTFAELTRRVEQTYALRRRVCDERAFVGAGEFRRALFAAARRNLQIARAARSVTAAFQALPHAYLQISSARRGSRDARYEAPNGG
jgi:rhamnosyltransferase